METKEIQVGYTFTKYLGNFENVKVDVGVRMLVGPGEDPEEIYTKAYKNCKQQIKKGLQEAKGGF